MADINADKAGRIARLEAQKKHLSREIGHLKSSGESALESMEQANELAARIKTLKAEVRRGEQPAAAKGASTTLLTTAADVIALEREWRELASVATANSPFISWEWIASWYESHEDMGWIRCFVVRGDDGKLTGIVPLFAADTRQV